ncbi:MAG: hypothetical protein LBQ58_06400 [Synergistaceae bacterium]|nr:hypothetical protein [Synergistaceae bacterium]
MGIFDEEILREIYNEKEIEKKLYTLFPEVYACHQEFQDVCINFHRNSKNRKADRIEHEKQMREIRDKKNAKVQTAISELSRQIKSDLENGQWKWDFQKSIGLLDTGEKKYYKLAKTSETFFAASSVAIDLKKAFDIQLKTRNQIMRDIFALITTDAVKANPSGTILVRTDIKTFSENIDYEVFLQIMRKNQRLSAETKILLEHYAEQFYEYSGRNHGIPRGCVVTTAVQDVLSQQVEDAIKAKIDGVLLCEHYGDDYFILLKGDCFSSSQEAFNQVGDIFSSYHLPFNKPKTKHQRFSSSLEFEFLGYKVQVKGDEILVDLREDYFQGVIYKLVSTFRRYRKYKANPISAVIMENELKIIMGNVTVMNKVNRQWVHKIGIVFNCPFLSKPSKMLEKIDLIFQILLFFSEVPRTYKKRLRSLSIHKSYFEHKMSQMTERRFNCYFKNHPILTLSGSRVMKSMT